MRLGNQRSMRVVGLPTSISSKELKEQKTCLARVKQYLFWVVLYLICVSDM